jgi:hypothetical protein
MTPGSAGHIGALPPEISCLTHALTINEPIKLAATNKYSITIISCIIVLWLCQVKSAIVEADWQHHIEELRTLPTEGCTWYRYAVPPGTLSVRESSVRAPRLD